MCLDWIAGPRTQTYFRLSVVSAGWTSDSRKYVCLRMLVDRRMCEDAKI